MESIVEASSLESDSETGLHKDAGDKMSPDNEDALTYKLARSSNLGDTDAKIDDKSDVSEKMLTSGSDSAWVNMLDQPDKDNEEDEDHVD